MESYKSGSHHARLSGQWKQCHLLCGIVSGKTRGWRNKSKDFPVPLREEEQSGWKLPHSRLNGVRSRWEWFCQSSRALYETRDSGLWGRHSNLGGRGSMVPSRRCIHTSRWCRDRTSDCQWRSRGARSGWDKVQWRRWSLCIKDAHLLGSERSCGTLSPWISGCKLLFQNWPPASAHGRELLQSRFADSFVDDTTEMSQDERRFMQNTEKIQLMDAHYKIPLPFKNGVVLVPKSKSQALVQIGWLKKRLENDPKLCDDYKVFMRELVAESCVRFLRFRWVLRTVTHGIYLTMGYTIPKNLEKLE